MKITDPLSDEAILAELGARLAAARLALNMTQASLAEQSGLSKRTIERLESGQAATQLSGFLRVCRVLGLLERLELFLPEVQPGPIEQLEHKGKRRQRASKPRSPAEPAEKWTWGEER